VARHSPLQLHSRGRIWLVRAFFAVLIVILGYLVFEFGRIQANFNIVDAAAERQAYEDRIEGLQNKIVGLKEQVVLLETHREIDKTAYKDVESSLSWHRITRGWRFRTKSAGSQTNAGFG